ncbi:long-chain fatty acid--CoA ligase [Halostella sp. JP-L12]|uniref:AMP-binding protein n=1 Tax=Halostella TaxID=1843185 RepID=UPI000EF7D678|nr:MULTISPECIES: AMP-binding protein [Halostella]NHN47197.1 long-chain fatty acid--CoA ligase [Halostella sp. JP-L12]
MIHDHGERPYDWVGDWSGRRATLSPDAVGLRDATTGEEYTYETLDARANRTARLLDDRGVGEGDRVAVVSRNRVELVDLFFAGGKTGAVLAPLSHRLAPPELGELLETVDPSLLVVEEPFVGDVAEALGEEVSCPRILLPADDWSDRDGEADAGDSPDGPFADAPTYADALPEDGAPVDGAELSLDDPAMLLHTGGSTGTPKETVLTHGALCWNSFNTITAWGLRPEDVTPMVFPMFHTGGWNVLTVPLFHLGATVVIGREVDPGRVLDTIESEGATVFVGVPAVLRSMATHDDWDDTDLSSLRFVKSGGGPCRDATIRAWRERGVDLSQGYGLTECGPNNFAMPDDWDEAKTDSIGKPVMHTDVRIVDEGGDPVSEGEIGELQLAGPHAAERYWRDEGETRATFGEGWVATGDLARVDGDGYYRIEGRKKNMFTSGGENVYPPEVEDALADHPDIEEVIVVGVPDERWGTVGKAVVQSAASEAAEGDSGDDESLTVDDLREFLDGRLAGFKHPRHVAFVDEMPTSGPSKIDRSAIERRFGESDGA